MSRSSKERLSHVEANVGAVGTLLISPCFHKGLGAAVVMGTRGEPSLLVTEASLDGTPVLFPRSLS
jgi:hypothetical protein